MLPVASVPMVAAMREFAAQRAAMTMAPGVRKCVVAGTVMMMVGEMVMRVAVMRELTSV